MNYKDLTVWQKSIELCTEVYRLTESFPKSEIYGLTSQIRRCSVAIPSNIAEGQKRGHKAEYIQFLRIAYGSGAEFETQLLIAQKIGYLSQDDFADLNHRSDEIMRMLNSLIQAIYESKTYNLKPIT